MTAAYHSARAPWYDARMAHDRQDDSGPLDTEPITEPMPALGPLKPARKPRQPKSFLRAAHGTAVERGNPGPRVEVPPADELSEKLPDNAHRPRHRGGPFVPGNPLARLGGVAKKGRVAFGASLGITKEMAEKFPAELQRALRKGTSYRVARTSELARMAGGECGIGPSSMAASAGLSLAASRYIFGLAALERDPMKKVKLFGLFAKLTAETRQNELAAYELAVREGKARKEGEAPPDPLAAYRGALPPGVVEQPAEQPSDDGSPKV
jgi:hypothetical protein